jgi:hypothetical protein
MRRITFRADETQIDQARAVARSEGRTLTAAFREWLEQYSDRAVNAADVARYRSLMARLRHVDAGRYFTRDEMNER